MFISSSRFIAILATLAFAACTRPTLDGELTTVQIQVPKIGAGFGKVDSMSLTLPAGKSACFGVQVSGSGIPSTPATTCAPALGSYAGFVAENGVLSLMVQKGDDRRFDLYIYLVNTGDPCPSWNESFNTTGNPFSNVYLAGSATGVNLSKDEETVNMTATMPASTVAATAGLNSCSSNTSASLRGMLYSNGDLVNSSGTPFASGAGDPSDPTTQSFFKTLGGASDVNGLLKMNSAHILNPATPIEIPPAIHSLTKQPDTGIMLGLLNNGSIVKVDASGNASACPLTTCSVPVWIQSISAGNNNALYALDHSGQVYSVAADGTLTFTGETVNPAVTQISYY